MWGVKGSEVTTACNEDCRKGAGEENAAYGESGRDAVWFYATQRNNRCSVHFKEVTRGVLGQGEEVVTSRLEMVSEYIEGSNLNKLIFADAHEKEALTIKSCEKMNLAKQLCQVVAY